MKRITREHEPVIYDYISCPWSDANGLLRVMQDCHRAGTLGIGVRYTEADDYGVKVAFDGPMQELPSEYQWKVGE